MSFMPPQQTFSQQRPLVIKARLGNDVRRVPIHREDLTYDDLILMMQRIYGSKLNPEDDILVKYTDEDGDQVTLLDNADLAHATAQGGVLRVCLYINGQLPPIFDPGMIEDIRVELEKVVTSVTELVKKMDIVAKTTIPAPKAETVAPQTDGNDNSSTEAASSPSPAPASQEAVSSFDPLAKPPASAPPTSAAATAPQSQGYQAATTAAGNANGASQASAAYGASGYTAPGYGSSQAYAASGAAPAAAATQPQQQQQQQQQQQGAGYTPQAPYYQQYGQQQQQQPAASTASTAPPTGQAYYAQGQSTGYAASSQPPAGGYYGYQQPRS